VDGSTAPAPSALASASATAGDTFAIVSIRPTAAKGSAPSLIAS
jgi:hypothetical protein